MKKRRERNVMLCYPFEESRLMKWEKPYIVQPKYDGIRCQAVVCDGKAELFTASGLPITTVPHIVEELKNIKHPYPLMFDGELYLHNEFSRCVSIVKRDYTHPDHKDVTYVIFDRVCADFQTSRLKSIKMFERFFDKYVIIAPYHEVSSLDEISELLINYYYDGYEGVIIRNKNTNYVAKRSTNIMKWKPNKSDFYTIIGIQEETTLDGLPKNRLGSFVVQTTDGDIFNVGSGLTQIQRERFWTSDIIGREIEVKYQELTHLGVPRFPVFLRII